MSFDNFHFHIYFQSDQLKLVEAITKELKSFEFLKIGRIWSKPVGPHPIGSCQISVQKEQFEFMSAWFLENRKGLDIFIHALTGDDYKDHTDYIMWIGKSHRIKTEIFAKESDS